jgi:hypothetical protein
VATVIDERVQSMARAYVERGLSYAQIGEEYGLSRQRVGQLLGPLGLARDREQGSKIIREQRLRAVHARVIGGEVTLERAAADLGYASGESLRSAFYDLGMTVVLDVEPPPHGTASRYRSRRYACRCDECRRANREKCAELRGQEPPQHGTYSGYVNYGCRCKACKEANRLTVRARRAAKRQRKEVKI